LSGEHELGQDRHIRPTCLRAAGGHTPTHVTGNQGLPIPCHGRCRSRSWHAGAVVARGDPNMFTVNSVLAGALSHRKEGFPCSTGTCASRARLDAGCTQQLYPIARHTQQPCRSVPRPPQPARRGVPSSTSHRYRHCTPLVASGLQNSCTQTMVCRSSSIVAPQQAASAAMICNPRPPVASRSGG
jgi:hypothetical protein